jgi:hypothetical protein
VTNHALIVTEDDYPETETPTYNNGKQKQVKSPSQKLTSPPRKPHTVLHNEPPRYQTPSTGLTNFIWTFLFLLVDKSRTRGEDVKTCRCCETQKLKLEDGSTPERKVFFFRETALTSKSTLMRVRDVIGIDTCWYANVLGIYIPHHESSP